MDKQSKRPQGSEMLEHTYPNDISASHDHSQTDMLPKVPLTTSNPVIGKPVKGTGSEILNNQHGIYIKQKVELVEVLTGCETENRYHVFPLGDDSKKKGTQIFKCKEISDACSRQCLNSDCRPFKMTISTVNHGGEDKYVPFLLLDRPCKCTCFCFKRPELLVTLVENGKNEYLGKIVEPFDNCRMEFKVIDKDNKPSHLIVGSFCQPGVWCQCPCGPCKVIDFQIKSANGDVVSTLQKRVTDCMKETYTDADNFALNFPLDAAVAQKALLMSAVLFLDFSYFEENPDKRRR